MGSLELQRVRHDLKTEHNHEWVLVGHLRRMFILLLLNGVSFLCILDIHDLKTEHNHEWVGLAM